MPALLADSDWASAVIGFAGVVVGGLLTFVFESRRERSRLLRDELAEKRTTQGIARVLSKRLGDFYVLVDEHSPPLPGSSWWSEEDDVDPMVDLADMKRVAAVTTRAQWREIDYALTHVREARAARKKALASTPEGTIGSNDLRRLRSAMTHVENAIESLAQLSDDQYPPEWLDRRIRRSGQPGGWRAAADQGTGLPGTLDAG